jgi:hypothetical protein
LLFFFFPLSAAFWFVSAWVDVWVGGWLAEPELVLAIAGAGAGFVVGRAAWFGLIVVVVVFAAPVVVVATAVGMVATAVGTGVLTAVVGAGVVCFLFCFLPVVVAVVVVTVGVTSVEERFAALVFILFFVLIDVSPELAMAARPKNVSTFRLRPSLRVLEEE